MKAINTDYGKPELPSIFSEDFWKLLADISEYQVAIAENAREIFFGTMVKNFIRLAPDFLSQTINPWQFSLFCFNSGYHSSDLELERNIVKKAGYGSQLGTVLDYIKLSQNKKLLPTDTNSKMNDAEKEIIRKFNCLVSEVIKAKQHRKRIR
jgi:hypothetical protein